MAKKRNEEKHVRVLLSTYNGEQYIEHQLDSILNQTYSNITIQVRDDGSTDGTREVLGKYAVKGLIQVTFGENLGFICSFYELLHQAEKADYYSFADQDDEWFPEKIERAVQELEDRNHDVPQLYHSNYDYYDQDLKFVSHKKPIRSRSTIGLALFGFTCFGFTCVFNNKLREMYLKMEPFKSFPQDYLCALIAVAMGEMTYDPKPSAKHRRHGGNASIGNESSLALLRWRIRNFLMQDSFDFTGKISDFYTVYYDYLSAEDRVFLETFFERRYNLIGSLCKSFKWTRYRNGFFDECAIRFMMLIGRL